MKKIYNIVTLEQGVGKMKAKLLRAGVFLVLIISLICVSVTGAMTILVEDSHLILEDDFILGIPEKCPGSLLKSNFHLDTSAVSDDEFVGTGLVINKDFNFVAVVLGDVNGDGALTSTDYLQIKRQFNGAIKLTGAYYRAADINGDGKIQSIDYLKIKRTFSGVDNIYEGMQIRPGFDVTAVVDGTGGTAYIEKQSLIVKPDSGYRLSSLKADGHDVYVTNGTLSLKDVANKTVVAKFTKIESVTADKVTPTSITNTFYNEEATQYGVTWRSESAGEPVLKYIEAGENTAEQADFTNAAEVTAYAEIAMGIYKNHAAMFELKPDTKYYYIVGDKSTNTYSPVCSITTKEENPSKVTFFHMSDTQDETYWGTYWNAAFKSAYTLYPDGAFTLNTGDITNNGGKEIQWTNMFSNTAEYTQNNVVMPVSGNHDYWGDITRQFHCVYSHFNIDLNRDWNQDAYFGIYYSFDYGDVHFTVLNTGDTIATDNWDLTEEQVEWLTKDLAATNKKWKIVALHNPLYSPGKYGSDTTFNRVALALRKQLNPIFAEYGVDLVLNGHDHVYSQSYPITASGTAVKDGKKEIIDGITYYVNPQGTIHLESGTAGSQNRGVLATGRRYSEKSDLTQTGNSYYSAITVEDNKLTVNYYEVNVESGTETLKYSWGILK